MPMSAVMKLTTHKSKIQDNNKQITQQNNTFTPETFKIPVCCYLLLSLTNTLKKLDPIVTLINLLFYQSEAVFRQI
jgi:hypothetical protein